MVARHDTTRSTRRHRAAISPVRRELAAVGRHPRKRLGQHFLADPRVARRIVDLAGLRDTDRVVEIGPGLGALSDMLVERAGEAWLIEVDSDLAQRLRSKYASLPHVHILEADVLTVDFADLLGPGVPAVVVANLPYNIATAVLAALLTQPECFSRMVLMLQREVVERLVAQPGGKTYGALSVLTQVSARVRPAMRVEPGAFVPRPKVESDVVIVEPYRQPPVLLEDPAVFTRLVKTAFGQRRKQMANSLRGVCRDAAALLRRVNVDPMRRPETLSLAEFAAVANALAHESLDRAAPTTDQSSEM